MMNANEIEVEAPVFAEEDTIQRYNDEATLGDEPQDDNESMNDESINNDIMASSPSRFARGFSNLSSSVKWSVIAFGTIAVALAVGLGSGYGIGNKIYGDDNVSTVSSAAAATAGADYVTYDAAGTYSNDYPGSKSGKSTKKGLSSIYIEETIAEGDSTIIYEAGPITIRAGCSGTSSEPQSFCDKRNVCMQLSIFNDEPTLVFGALSDGVVSDSSLIGQNSLPRNTLYEAIMWTTRSEGNEDGTGAIWADEYYVGWSGESFIGVRRNQEDSCIIAGILNVKSPRHHSSKSSKDFF